MKLSVAELEQHLEQQPDWKLEQGRLSRSFLFGSYGAGVAFAVQVALLSEKLDHHPDSLEIGWKKVTVAYITHSAGGITKLDFEAAGRVNAL
jgi:4a-hydroxytetrahydrobiopterin dehydratase